MNTRTGLCPPVRWASAAPGLRGRCTPHGRAGRPMLWGHPAIPASASPPSSHFGPRPCRGLLRAQSRRLGRAYVRSTPGNRAHPEPRPLERPPWLACLQPSSRKRLQYSSRPASPTSRQRSTVASCRTPPNPEAPDATISLPWACPRSTPLPVRPRGRLLPHQGTAAFSPGPYPRRKHSSRRS